MLNVQTDIRFQRIFEISLSTKGRKENSVSQCAVMILDLSKPFQQDLCSVKAHALEFPNIF